MVPVVLVLLGLFLSGYAIVTLQRGVGQIVAGSALLVCSLAGALIPLTPSSSSAPHADTFTMDVSGR